METCVSRITHKKYASTYHKVLTGCRNLHKAKTDSPTLVNFLALVRWVDAETANRIGTDVGIQARA